LTSHAHCYVITEVEENATYPYFTKADWMDEEKYIVNSSGKISVKTGGIYIVHGSVSVENK